jgi:hypothetical protein
VRVDRLASGSLDDAVEGDEFTDDQAAHGPILSVRVSLNRVSLIPAWLNRVFADWTTPPGGVIGGGDGIGKADVARQRR